MYAAALVVTALVAWTSAQQPTPCCTPDQWEATLVEAGGYVQGSEPKTLMGSIEVSYDFNDKKMALNQMLNNSGIPVQAKVIMRYDQGKMYTIANGACIESDLPTDMPQQCITNGAMFERTMHLGGAGGLEVNSFGLWNVQGVTYGSAQMTATDCLPVSEVIIEAPTSQILGSVLGVLFDGVTTGIKDPSVFDPPSPPCNRLTVTHGRKIRSIGTPFFQSILRRFEIPTF